METILGVAVLVALVIVVGWGVRRQRIVKPSVRYVCNHCGKTDCECTKQET
jgi:hypothetical protein